ncbi:MRPL31-mitochondrial ribosomal large subunit [Chlorella sorokiniana]|uniref:MRPL31-mitochondrial ribosomal large subunit n=1 Tax=Chlorella sorokiniana TaxID=3076 RepID=A0A2P6TWT3_CHLSO|nr:MRPL31-mitochondrial ribosomal large subunit [Chlorella sorokiniana]|eukprot:PRW58524.1 MRPL31-mitochondrial ribosomal large subunit [Chlorella sorokiniana]
MRQSAGLLFRACQVLETVKKSTGGRAWQKPWGFSGFTKTQTRNRQKQIKQEQDVMAALRQAEAGEGAAAAAAGKPRQ